MSGDSQFEDQVVSAATPEHIMQVGLGFWASKTLLSAVELGVFSTLADAPADGLSAIGLLCNTATLG
jgi:Dimerisation domain